MSNKKPKVEKEKKERKSYSEETKRAAVADLEGGATLEQAATKYGTSINSVSNWKREFGKKKVKLDDLTASAMPGDLNSVEEKLLELALRDAAMKRKIVNLIVAGRV